MDTCSSSATCSIASSVPHSERNASAAMSMMRIVSFHHMNNSRNGCGRGTNRRRPPEPPETRVAPQAAHVLVARARITAAPLTDLPGHLFYTSAQPQGNRAQTIHCPGCDLLGSSLHDHDGRPP